MQSPNFTDPQFVDANGVGGLNAAFGTVSGAIAALGSGVWAFPGLVSPEGMTVSFSGLTATIGLPAPWGLVTSGGALVRAHGTLTGADTQTYTVPFSGLVPASGSAVAYLTATITSIQQNPFPIPGPPQGDPSYNPTYVPTEGYATNLLTVALAAVGTQPNNTTGFELLRTTLTAGQSGIASWTTIGQQRATPRAALPPIPLASGGLLSAQQAQGMLLPTVSGLTHTLPPVSGAGGLFFNLFNPLSSNWTIATTGADRIGTPAASGGVSSMVVPPSGSATLWGNAASGTWEVMGSQTFAALGGNAGQPFLAANAASGTQQVVPIAQADARYAAIAGSATQTFSMTTQPVGTNNNTGASTAFVIANTPPMTIQGGYTGLVGQVTSNTAGTWAASAITVANASGDTIQLRGVSVSYATGTIGAGGYDGNGALGVSQWLAFFIIYNPTTSTAAALCSHSATAPTLPSGYTYFRYVGSVYLDASGYLMRVLQRGNCAQYVVTPSTNTATLPQIANGTSAWPTSLYTGSFVPPSASNIRVVIVSGNGGGVYTVAPNSNYAFGSNINPPPGQIIIGSSSGAGSTGETVEMVLETAYIYWGSTNAGNVWCLGWKDNI